MSRYRMDDKIIDTDKAHGRWNEDSDWDGSNRISRATGSQWEHQTLYKSSAGRYYIEHDSNYQGNMPSMEFVTDEEAAVWLLQNNHELPKDLQRLEESIVE